MSTDPHVTITDSFDLLAPAVDFLRREGVAVTELQPDLDPLEAAEQASGSDAVIVGVMPFDEPGLARLAGGPVRLIVRAGIGYDNVNVPAAHRHGIQVSNVPDYCTDEVADHTLLLLLAAERRLTTVRELGVENWSVATRLPPVHRLSGRVLGIIGFGRIGQKVARRAAAFGYDVIAHDPGVPNHTFTDAGVRSVELDELLRHADAITLHCPLTTDTTHLIDRASLAHVRPGGVLVNTSRGGLVNLDDVDGAVESGILASVALDVLDGEPEPPLDHPLLSRPEVLVTPHVAWYSLDARHALAVKSAEEALRSVRGEPLRNAIR